MSTIIAKNNFYTQNWVVAGEILDPYNTTLEIGFVDQGPVVYFTNLKFGYTLSSDGAVVEMQAYPPQGTKYIQTDQEYIVTHRLNLHPETAYSLFLWAENDGVRHEYTHDFVAPRPSQPFPSWIWNGVVWEAPVPTPQDENYYWWDEATLAWVQYENEVPVET